MDPARRVGLDFVESLNNPDTIAHINGVIDKIYAKDEPQTLHANFIRGVWHAAKSARILTVVLSGNTLEELATAVRSEGTGAIQLAEAIMKYHAQDSTALFVHVDEAGQLKLPKLHVLQAVMCQVCTRIRAEVKEGRAMPHILFYVSGKGLHFLDLGTSTGKSPTGVAWITLPMLEEADIRTIRQSLSENNELQLNVSPVMLCALACLLCLPV